jgi:hypothetical protein
VEIDMNKPPLVTGGFPRYQLAHRENLPKSMITGEKRKP